MEKEHLLGILDDLTYQLETMRTEVIETADKTNSIIKTIATYMEMHERILNTITTEYNETLKEMREQNHE